MRKQRVSATGSYCPLAELQSGPRVGRSFFLPVVVFDADYGAYFRCFEVPRYPFLNGFVSSGVEIAVDAAFGLEKHVAEEVGAERWVVE